MTATTDAGEAVEVAFYPEVGLYTLVWPEGVALDGEVVVTPADGRTESQPL